MREGIRSTAVLGCATLLAVALLAWVAGGIGGAAAGPLGPTGTVLCKVEPEASEGTLFCPPGEGFSGIVRGAPPSSTTFESTAGPEGTISCSYAFLTMSFAEDGTAVEGPYSQFTIGGCTSTLAGEPEVKTGSYNAPYEASRFVYLSALAPQAAMVIAKVGGEAPVIRLASYGEGPDCMYRATLLGGQVVNGPPPRLIQTADWELFEENAAGCPLALHQETTMRLAQNLEAEEDLYVAAE